VTLASHAAVSGDRPGPGRPRDEELDELILRAAVELIDEGIDISVSKVVQRSGVSRAAMYRRWPSITHLTAAALDAGRTAYPAIRITENFREELLRLILPPSGMHEQAYPHDRFRQRLKLSVSNPELQKAYWESHVSRRRIPLEETIREASRRGVLRADLDVAACVDALAGVAYYQLVVRGDDLFDPATRQRVQEATDVLWRGMQP